MFPSKRILIAAGTLAAAAGLAATPVLAQDDGQAPQQPPSAEASDHARPSPEEMEARKAERLAAMAEVLGVSVEDLTAAHEAARQAVTDAYGEIEKPTPNPDATEEEREAAREARKAEMEPRKELFTQTVADTLGISVDDLTAARKTLATEKVNEKLAAGEITQEQADAMLEKIESGEFGPPGRGHRGPKGNRGPHGPNADQQPADAPA